MTVLSLTFERQLARTCRLTNWLRARFARPRPIARLMQAIDFVARGVFYVWRNRQYLSALKLGNMALVNVQYKLKTERVLGRPYRMKIESTNICNTKCQLCPTGIGLEGRPKGRMSYEQFTRLIDRSKRWLYTVDLSMWGDPLIVPDIYRMIRYAHDAGVWTYISSNLHAFKPDNGQAEALIESGLDMLTCSLHGATQKTFEHYQPGKSFSEAIEKVRHIVAVRDHLGSKTPAIQLNFVVTKHNEHEIESFRRLADELGCKPVFSWAALNTRFLGRDKKLRNLGLSKDEQRRRVEEHIREWLPSDKRYMLDAYAKMLEGEFDPASFNGNKLYDCSWPWRASVVNYDGQVVTCCGSFDPAEDMGNVFEKPFGRIWNGPKYRLARRSFKKKLNDDQAADNPCAECPGFML